MLKAFGLSTPENDKTTNSENRRFAALPEPDRTRFIAPPAVAVK
jgi:hypothetical protein